jgi:hypothetical protein
MQRPTALINPMLALQGLVLIFNERDNVRELKDQIFWRSTIDDLQRGSSCGRLSGKFKKINEIVHAGQFHL